ncbi:hypothetical protein HJG60_009646 [Phyllostomus discolor]|uniref:Uncharacterized protein n=1 Tax=Phyllostomus discolor TaxID=89673 RepID=A0A834B961_9CHIR|nr:hypothetical protein HJG60_009646 [Phyllostomus discolor]
MQGMRSKAYSTVSPLNSGRKSSTQSPVDTSARRLCNMLQTGPRDTAATVEATQPGRRTVNSRPARLEDDWPDTRWWSGWRTRPRTEGSDPQHPVIAVLGDPLVSVPSHVPNRKGWLSAIRVSHSSQNTTKHRHCSILGCRRPIPTDLLTQACSAGGEGRGQEKGNVQLLGEGNRWVGREGLHQSATPRAGSDLGRALPRPPWLRAPVTNHARHPEGDPEDRRRGHRWRERMPMLNKIPQRSWKWLE